MSSKWISFTGLFEELGTRDLSSVQIQDELRQIVWRNSHRQSLHSAALILHWAHTVLSSPPMASSLTYSIFSPSNTVVFEPNELLKKYGISAYSLIFKYSVLHLVQIFNSISFLFYQKLEWFSGPNKIVCFPREINVSGPVWIRL